MLTFLIVLFVINLLHLATIAAVGRGVGVAVRELSLGGGPALFTVGAFKFGIIPVSGYVRFRDSRMEVLRHDEMSTALDTRSAYEQLAICLSGCVGLLVVSVAAAGRTGLAAFADFPIQFFAGALSPLGEAQTLIRAGWEHIHSAPVGALVGALCAMYAALNLLPFPTMNGGAAIALVGRRLGLDKWWPAAAGQILGLVHLALLVSWLVALTVFGLQT